MDLNLLSLPLEILTKIFSNIPWNQLINVKLTSRKFNFVTKKYHRYMQKPKPCFIEIKNDYTHNDGIGRIKIICHIYMINEDGIEKNISRLKEFFLLPSELCHLPSFLKKFDLTSLLSVDILLDHHTEVMRIFSDYLHNSNRICSIFVTAKNCQNDLDNTLLFLQKIKNTRFLSLDLYFPHLNIPKDFVIPVENSLKSIRIYERENTAFVNSRMIEYIVENNPYLDGYRLSFNNFETYKMVIETIVKGELSRRNNGCFHKYITLYLGFSSHEVFPELLRYFYSEEFPYIGTDTEDENSFNGHLGCLVCGKFDSIKIEKKTF
uniref:F-box domain-containing protein n=1 Tax=Strongyloides venezuelensis TaxID=75913 RepID=A0A0K0EWE1_STRVS